MIDVAPHPLLDVRAFTAEFARLLSELDSPSEILNLMRLDGAAPLSTSDEVRRAVRDLLRSGGFKPTGRSKPASEYLIKAAAEESLTSINLAVDACNVRLPS